MNAADFLTAADGLPFADIEQIFGPGGFVVVAPHPDDESLGCGGMIAAARARGIAVRIVVVSDGVGSHPNSMLYPPARLKALREGETLAAASALGLDATHVHFLGLPDAAVPTSGQDADDAVDAIVAAARACAATAVLVTWRFDPHCDHAAAAVLADAAARRIGLRVLAYPIWGWSLPPATEVGSAPSGSRFDISPFLSAKASAIAAHASQTTALISDVPDGFRLEPSMLERFARPYEIVLDARDHQASR